MTVSESELSRARELFRELLKRDTREAEWQLFFAQHPYVLSRSLPIRLESTDIVPLGRPGRAEPDLVFYPRHTVPIPYYGVIELKRPESAILSVPRSNVAILTRDAATAIAQARAYGESPALFLPPDHQPSPLFLGNRSYMFVIMGMSAEISRLGHELYRRSIESAMPSNLQLIPYDTLLDYFEANLPPRVFMLRQVAPESRRISQREREERVRVAADVARRAYVNVTVGEDTVIVNYEYATSRAAHAFTNVLSELGFRMAWNSVMIDGEDEEWVLEPQ